jgi:probable HAF family extracellular repeat protein
MGEMQRADLKGLRPTVRTMWPFRRHAVGVPTARRAGRTVLLAALLLVGILAFAMPRAAAAFEIRDLGTLPGDQLSTAAGINEVGQIVGFSSQTFGGPTAVLWSNGGVKDLGTLPGDVYSLAQAINDAGQVVGYSIDSSFNSSAFLWESDAMTELPNLGGGPFGIAFSINEAGQIVGGSGGQMGPHAVLWSNGGVKDLGTLPGDPISLAYDINDLGLIVGGSGDMIGPRPVIWQDGNITELSTLPGDVYALAASVNNGGQIVGFSGVVYSNSRAVLWDNGTITDLGTLPGDSFSAAVAINDAGQVVGFSGSLWPDISAVLWDNGTITDLGTLPGHVASSAVGINDAGQIVGGSTPSSGETHAVLWATVEALHDVAVLSASASPRTVQVGTPVTIAATIQNQGTGPETFEVQAFAGSRPVGNVTITDLVAGASEDVSFVWDTSTTSAGTYAMRVEAARVSGETDAADNTLAAGTVVVYLPLTAQASAPAETDMGLSIALACVASGGISPYAYAWDFGDGLEGSGATVEHAYSTEGTKTAICTVTDAASHQTSSETTVLVNPAPSVTASVDRTAVSPGRALAFSAQAGDGSGGFEYTWSFGDGDTANTASASHAYTGPGTYTATVTIRDRVGGIASKSFDIDIAYLVLTATASATSATSGRETITFEATAVGGTGDSYTFTWEFGDGKKATGATVSHVYSSPGSYVAKVTVVDRAGDSNTTVLAPITVQSADLFTLGDPIVGFGIGTVIAIAAAVVVALIAARRRRPAR